VTLHKNFFIKCISFLSAYDRIHIFLLFLKGKQFSGSVSKRKAWSVLVCTCLYSCSLVYESISVNILHWYMEVTLTWVSAKLPTSLRYITCSSWVFSYQYHSTNVLYTHFIHLPLTQCNLAVNFIIKKNASYICPLLNLWCIKLCSWKSLITSKDHLFIVTFIIFWKHMYSEQTSTHT